MSGMTSSGKEEAPVSERVTVASGLFMLAASAFALYLGQKKSSQAKVRLSVLTD